MRRARLVWSLSKYGEGLLCPVRSCLLVNQVCFVYILCTISSKKTTADKRSLIQLLEDEQTKRGIGKTCDELLHLEGID